MSEAIEDMVEEVQDQSSETVLDDDNSNPSHPKWVEYVLDHVAPNELMEGYPTTDGLRRVTQEIYGDILMSDSELLEIPNIGSNGPARATVKHTLVVKRYSDGQEIQVSACADTRSDDKLRSLFHSHLVSTTCTRAEGKALRRLLKIRLHTAEEVSESIDSDDETKISDQQCTLINLQAKRFNVDVEKICKSVNEKSKKMSDLSSAEAKIIIKKLGDISRLENEDDELVQKFSGYKSNWDSNY